MITKIICDYGGVFTTRSRTTFIASALAKSLEQRTIILDFFESDFIKRAAIGKKTTAQIVSCLQNLLENTEDTRIRDALWQACEPDLQMMAILRRLVTRYSVFVMSDSLPPFTACVTKLLGQYVDGFFLSDQLGARKSDGLFALAELLHPALFKDSVFIDDREVNLVEARRRGACALCFKSTNSLITDLRKVGVVFD